MIKSYAKINKKQAQHVVELALIMPVFIILFGFTFQLMVETFVKYKFSYIFTGAVKNSVVNQPVFENKEQKDSYDFAKETEDIVINSMGGANSSYININTKESIITPNTDFFIGTFKYNNTKPFFGKNDGSYFYFIIPINRAYVEAPFLNKNKGEIENYFKDYFDIYSGRYYEEQTLSNPSAKGPDESAPEEPGTESKETEGIGDDEGLEGAL